MTYHQKKDPYILMYYDKYYREREKNDPSFWSLSPVFVINCKNHSFTVSQIKTWHIDKEAHVVRDVSLNISIVTKTSSNFVCGFVDYKDKDLLNWRKETNESPENMTVAKMIKILKRFFCAIQYFLLQKIKEIYDQYEYSR